MPPEGILFGEKLLHECLIYNRNHAGRGRVLLAEAAAANHRLADGFEEMRTDAIPRRAVVFFRSGRGTALYVDSLAPVITLERAVQGDADALDARKRRKLLLQALVERAHGIDVVSSAHGIDMDDVAIRRGNAKVLMFEIAQGLGH